jgi:molybdopterin-guanine dinucleotide biosynthesis protein
VRILSITSTTSGTGKTTIASFLIKELGRLNALKITVQHHGACPKEIDCDGCPTTGSFTYKITTDPTVLSQPRKDTDRYLKAGADKVVWLQSQRKYLETATQQALKLFPPRGRLIVEGNSFLSIRKANFAIMVTMPGTLELKPSARKILDKVDLFMINKHPGHTKEEISMTWEKLQLLRPDCHVIVFDPYHPEPETSAAVVRTILYALDKPERVEVRRRRLVGS